MSARTPPPERASRPALSAPREVLHLAERLRAAGGQAWVVGGAVRDLLLGREVHDWDLATDLPPERTTSLFPRTMEVGARFGTITVLIREASYEITTFRRDGLYSDARRPDEVRYAEHLEDDLVRRDFTVNALAWDPIENRLADPTGGLDDLDARLLRAVGDPVERFTEDGLRLLRAVRFAAQLDFEIEAETYRALVLCAPRLERIAAERVRDELEKLLLAPRPSSALLLLQETGLLRRILPELSACYGVPQNRHHAYDVFHHTLAAVDAAPPDNRIVRLAALFHDTGKPREPRGAGGRRHLLRAPVGRTPPRGARPAPPALSRARTGAASPTSCSTTCSTTGPSGPTRRCAASCARSARSISTTSSRCARPTPAGTA